MTQHERVEDMKGMLERALERFRFIPGSDKEMFAVEVRNVVKVMQHNLENGFFDNTNPLFHDLAPGIKLTTP